MVHKICVRDPLNISSSYNLIRNVSSSTSFFSIKLKLFQRSNLIIPICLQSQIDDKRKINNFRFPNIFENTC